MDIDLSLLHSNTVSNIDITGTYNIDFSYYKGTDIIKLSEVNVKGIISRRKNDDYIDDDYCECSIDGMMVLPDSISFEDVEYEFHIDYDDFIDINCRKSENILDIFEFLWENIVLEVPLQYTEVKDFSEFHGDGWRLISSDELNKNNNPFNDLLNDIEKE